ncbi:MAG: folylpolyglutamate synthase/dihydrofolate synthase family protein [Acidobacteriota bacterium]|nr:bifunctional folylpolyglutamate synthase/dihydrofolate synthase [Blastocatellia bacterium]MDW8241300.1 folylpolyglutamate synthase/dihydrofolate synthase family protein [Acidobacteriota bacterium]
MNYQQIVDYLIRRGNELVTADFRLERMQRLLTCLGQPQDAVPSIIVAGTNGKGSVSAMMESVLRQAGWRTGLYTSPHLVSICERIQVGGRLITPEEFAAHASRVWEVGSTLVSRGELSSMPTFFEHVTAVGFLHFCQQRVDVAVLEVGLGGRLDATNVAPSFMALISQIDFDHQDILGDTIEAIAREKSGVIKNSTKAVVVAPQRPAASSVIEQRCQLFGLQPQWTQHLRERVCVDQIDADGCVRFSLRTDEREYRGIRLSLPGDHQIENAVVVIRAAEMLNQLGICVPADAVIAGLQVVQWPGRLEWLVPFQSSTDAGLNGGRRASSNGGRGRPAILLDGAHNRAGAVALRSFLERFLSVPITFVFGVMRDKQIAEMAQLLFPPARHVILTRVENERSADPDEIEPLVSPFCRHVLTTRTVEQAMRQALALTPPNGLICVAGSLYLVGAVKQLWPTVSRRLAAIGRSSPALAPHVSEV